ncbi:hypothetical protein ACTMU2_22430 [Cupriavidus basilensis]
MTFSIACCAAALASALACWLPTMRKLELLMRTADTTSRVSTISITRPTTRLMPRRRFPRASNLRLVIILSGYSG